jgi:hypothetical protein
MISKNDNYRGQLSALRVGTIPDSGETYKIITTAQGSIDPVSAVDRRPNDD